MDSAKWNNLLGGCKQSNQRMNVFQRHQLVTSDSEYFVLDAREAFSSWENEPLLEIEEIASEHYALNGHWFRLLQIDEQAEPHALID